VHHLCAAELSSDDVHFTIYEVDGSSKKKDPVEPIDDYRVSLAVDSQE
jgi:hypothetical protein